MTLTEFYTNLPIDSYRLTDMIYSLKVQNIFTYSLITGNILNSLKKEQLSKRAYCTLTPPPVPPQK